MSSLLAFIVGACEARAAADVAPLSGCVSVGEAAALSVDFLAADDSSNVVVSTR